MRNKKTFKFLFLWQTQFAINILFQIFASSKVRRGQVV